MWLLLVGGLLLGVCFGMGRMFDSGCRELGWESVV
jgi:hypothetical protein